VGKNNPTSNRNPITTNTKNPDEIIPKKKEKRSQYPSEEHIQKDYNERRRKGKGHGPRAFVPEG